MPQPKYKEDNVLARMVVTFQETLEGSLNVSLDSTYVTLGDVIAITRAMGKLRDKLFAQVVEQIGYQDAYDLLHGTDEKTPEGLDHVA